MHVLRLGVNTWHPFLVELEGEMICVKQSLNCEPVFNVSFSI